MDHSPRFTLAPGKDATITNRTPLAMRIRVVCHADGTMFRVTLAPGAEAIVTGGTGPLSLYIDDANADFTGLQLVRHDTGG